MNDKPNPGQLGINSVMTRKLYQLLEWAGPIVPGVILALLVAVSGKALANGIGKGLMGFDKSPISGIMMAIILGIILRNTIGLPAIYLSGLQFSLKRILRLGIILLGLRLSFVEAGKIGLAGLPVVIGCIGAALLLVTLIGRYLKLPRRLSCLIAVGTSICGATAIVATGPVIDAEDDEVTYAIACITIFGILAMFTYPYLAYWLFAGDPTFAGLFLGTSIHETAQVAGAGMMYQQQYDAQTALDVATVTKLVRNVCMAGVIPLLGILYQRGSTGTSDKAVKKWYQMIPLFVIGFIGCTIIRSVGDMGDKPFGVLEAGRWESIYGYGVDTAKFLLTIAMAAVGLNTSIAKLKNLGFKPFCVGFVAAVLVGGISIVLVKVCGPLL
ncbi:MAG: putative sulfate exporter family transporter [Planctomycetes bacterium]|nr:putative sulfate exporter family transporter [Planctomycetota bacterium]